MADREIHTQIQYRLLEELQAAERRGRDALASLAESALDAVIVIDDRGLVVSWNPRAATLFGWTREEAVGRSLAELVIPEAQRAAHRDGLARHGATGEARVLGRRVEVTARHRDGREFPVELSITPLEGERGRLYGGFVRDITERRAAEAALRDARDAAEAASRAKSAFVANISHEIRTPLNAVLGMAELLSGETLDPTHRRYVDVIQRTGATLLALLDDVLDLSRIESGRVELARVPFDPTALAATVLEGHRPAADARGIALRFEPVGQLPAAVLGDPSRVAQVLSNLVGNAVKFTPSGEVTLSLRAGPGAAIGFTVRDTGVGIAVKFTPAGEVTLSLRAGPGAAMSFTVRDTGVGIAPDKLAFVFERFTQVDASSTRRHGGVGLGLAISRELVARMGGALHAESDGVRGSAFHVELPLPRCEPVAPPATPAPRVDPARALRVLLVEDNPDNVLLTRAYLGGGAYDVDVAEDGEQAVERFCEGRYDVVLMDIQMPVLDGLEATQRIRAWERDAGRPRTPVLALTAHASVEDERRSLEAGCDGHLRKPLRKRTLLEAIARVAG